MYLRILAGAALGIAAAVLSHSAGAEGQVGVWVDRVISAYGGPPALERAAVMVQHGRTMSAMRGGAVGTVVREIDGPGRLRVEITYPGRVTELRILNGADGWNQRGPVPGPMHGAMRLQAARISLPRLLDARRGELRDAGASTGSDGIVVRRLELPLGQGLSLFVDIAVDSWLIRRSTGTVAVNGQSVAFVSEYADYRDWGGVLLPSREDQYAMGQYIGYTEIDRIEFRESLPPEQFRPGP